ncbi:hypothetical protein BGZ65_005828, partial [Modicella reniformis]
MEPVVSTPPLMPLVVRPFFSEDLPPPRLKGSKMYMSSSDNKDNEQQSYERPMSPMDFQPQTSEASSPSPSVGSSSPPSSIGSPSLQVEPEDEAEVLVTQLSNAMASRWGTTKVGMVDGIPVINDNKVSCKAMGECILRAAIHVFSRDFAYMTPDLFMAVYRQLYGNPKLGGAFGRAEVRSFLSCKMISGIFQTVTTQGAIFHRLDPRYFENIALALSLPPLVKTKDVYFSLHNRVGLPPIRPISLRIIANIIGRLEANIINIGRRFEPLCPSQILDGVPLKDLCRYLPIWHPKPNLGGHVIQPTNSKSEMRPHEFWGLLLKAKGSGMEAKQARKQLDRHSARIMKNIEVERKKVFARMVKKNNDGTLPMMVDSKDAGQAMGLVSDTLQDRKTTGSDNDMVIDGPATHASASMSKPQVTTASQVDRKGKGKVTEPEWDLELALSLELETKGVLDLESAAEWRRRLEKEFGLDNMQSAKHEPSLKPSISAHEPYGSGAGWKLMHKERKASSPTLSAIPRATEQRILSPAKPLISATSTPRAPQGSLLQGQHIKKQLPKDKKFVGKLKDHVEIVDLTKDSDSDGEGAPKHVDSTSIGLGATIIAKSSQ